MNDESLIQIEQQITALQPQGLPLELRGAVLGDVQRELRAARWDRRLARAAVVLLVVGVGLNLSTGWRLSRSSDGSQPGLAGSRSHQSLVDTAVAVAEATDAATGSRFAQQLAVMSGRTLSRDEIAVIDAAVRRAASTARSDNRG